MPGFLTADFYQQIARTLEAGKFHLAFFDDRLAMPDRYGDDFAAAVRHGIRVVKLDLIPLLTAMGMATRHLGLGGTYSTTYYEPFHVARALRDAGPHGGRPGGVERRHVAERLGGGQLRRRRAIPTTTSATIGPTSS